MTDKDHPDSPRAVAASGDDAAAHALADRRRKDRRAPAGTIGVSRVIPVLPLADAQVLNTSPGGVALRTRVAVRVGERLSFRASPHTPPILAEILAVDAEADGSFRVRCRCLLGGFED